MSSRNILIIIWFKPIYVLFVLLTWQDGVAITWSYFKAFCDVTKHLTENMFVSAEGANASN